METCLLLLIATILVSFFYGSGASSLTIKNNCPYTIWPGIQDNPSVPPLGNTGFSLAQGAATAINAPANWAGRIWARTFCTNDASGRFSCPIGDCATGQVPCNGKGGTPPVSLAEFTLNGNGGNTDYYDVSLVDGFNLPVSVVPSGSGCQATACPVDINSQCLGELAVRDSKGAVIGCKSACLAFKTDAYCCTGAFNDPKVCKPSNYSQFFKSRCPQAYTYAYEDKSSLTTCPSGGDYVITFCP